jgi:hypothetical protein
MKQLGGRRPVLQGHKTLGLMGSRASVVYTMVSQRCYVRVTMVFRWCRDGVPMVVRRGG